MNQLTSVFQTTQTISGACIPTIPKGTQFTITHFGTFYSLCKGLPINSIYNDEFEPVMGHDFSI